MTDYREQAIKDVAEAIGEQVSTIEAILSDRTREISTSEEGAAIRYAVSQREARLRLREALEWLVDKCHTYGGPKGGKMDLSKARAAISAEKEG